MDYGAETIIFWERLLTIRSRSQTPRMIGEVVVPLACEWDFGDAGAGDSGDAVVTNEALIEHTELGVDDVNDTEVGVDHLADEGAGFMEHGVLENDLELRVELGVGGGKVDVLEAEPAIGEVPNEGIGA